MEIQKKFHENNIELFSKESECCGCGACMNICPNNAISMKNNEYGFTYPLIDRTKCISCGICLEVCSYNKSDTDIISDFNTEAYSSVAKNPKLLNRSASGGIFAVLAENIINNDGVVFGCSMESVDRGLVPMHIKIESVDELEKLQGSKYVQSEIGYIYRTVKEELKKGKTVLFSGTPCQVDGLKGYLRGKIYENLLTVDIICHGVPSTKMFEDYIRVLSRKRKNKKIVSFVFRDKKAGWSYKSSYEYLSNGKDKKKVMLPFKLSSYYSLFLESAICRENCYTCPYASGKRYSDITIGDFWGITREHPEYLLSNGGSIDESKGVSCIIVNTAKGKKFINKINEEIICYNSKFTKVANNNEQLVRPSKKPSSRYDIMNIYKEKGYLSVEKWFNKKLGFKRYLYMIWNVIPECVKNKLKRR